MSQENVELVRRLRRVSCRRSFLRAVGGVACVGVIAVSAAPAGGTFPVETAGFPTWIPISAEFPASGRTGRQAAAGPRHGGVPEYSPRGDRIVFSRFFRIEPTDTPFITYFDVGRLELVGADGRGRTVLTGGDDYSPAWAPDGKLIVFARNRPCDRYYNAEGDCPPRVQRDKKYGSPGPQPRWAHAGGDPRGPEPEVVAGRQLDQLSERGQRGWDRAVRDAAARFAESTHRQSHRRFAPSEPRLVVARRQSDRAQLFDSERLRHRGDPERRDRLAPPAPQWVRACLLPGRPMDRVQPTRRAALRICAARDLDHARTRRTSARPARSLQRPNLRIGPRLAATALNTDERAPRSRRAAE